VIRFVSKLLLLFLLFSFLNLPLTNSLYLDTETSRSNTFTAACWGAPSTPSLVSPANNYLAKIGSGWLEHPLVDWSDSHSVCPNSPPLYYIYESYRDSGLHNLAYRSSPLFASQIPAPNTPEGTYWWRVKACDAPDNCSDWSEVWQITVDRTPPSTPTLSITGSYTKSVEETIQNGSFESGLSGWTSTGDVAVLGADTIQYPDITVNPYSGDSMVRLGVPEGQPPCEGAMGICDIARPVWENRLMGTFESGAKSLSLAYNFFSRDYPNFDDPGFAVKLNGQEIYRLSAFSVNPNAYTDGFARQTGWSEFYYDLSNLDTGENSLVLYSGNNRSDDMVQSWTYVDKITTYFVSAPLHATYSFHGGDNSSGSGLAYYRYQLDSNDWLNIGAGDTFMVTTPGTHTIRYFSVDNAGNESVQKPLVKIVVDGTAPSAVTDLTAQSPTANTATLYWTAPGNDGTSGRASTYDLRYSLSPIDSSNFATAIKLSVPSPQNSGIGESFIVGGLNPSATYYFALKTADEAPNWSELSNLVTAVTSSGYSINPGDIVINEIHWIEGSNPETLLELHNTTNRTLTDLSQLNLVSHGLPIQNFAGTTLSPYGYLLLSTSDSLTTNLLPSVTIDIPNSNLSFSRTSLDLILEWNSTPIDFAWDPAIPVTEGLVDSTPGSEKYYSLERVSDTTQSGDNPLSWYPCIDSSTSSEFFISITGLEFHGTPRSQNRSVNEPFGGSNLSRPTPTPSLVSTPTPTPIPFQPSLTYSASTHRLNLTISNIPQNISQNPLNSLSYEIIYTSSSGEQGIAGTLNSSEISPPSLNRQFYLGTCSDNGICTPSLGVGSSFSLSLTTLINGITASQSHLFEF
jgi:hypothetical protein